MKSRRLRKNLRNFRSKRVDISKYVKDFYVENGLAYISCNVKGMDDIISNYSVKGYEWLNESFASFISGNANYIPSEYPIVLEICGGRFDNEQRKTIEKAVADHYALELGDAQMMYEKTRNKCLFLLSLALVFASCIWMILKGTASFGFNEAIYVLFWFSLWECANCFCFDRTDAIEERTAAARMASIKIVFSEVFKDEPVADAQAVLAEIFDEEPEEKSGQEE